MSVLRIGSTFSGIGGLDLAILAATGGRVAWHVESDPYCRAVLAERFPGIRCYDDIRTLDAAAIEPVDIVIGGPPCQPSSAAGKRKGAADDRWLWPDFLRVVREVRPGIVFAENPSALLTVDDGRGFGGILGAMAVLGVLGVLKGQSGDGSAGYTTASGRHSGTTLTDAGGAGDVGDALRTRRVWAEQQNGQGEGWSGSSRPGGEAVVADAEMRGLRRGPPSWASGQPALANEGRVLGQAQPGLGRDADGARGRLDRWPAPPGPQHAHEPPRVTTETQHRRPRLKALGNAVVPQQALLAWDLLAGRICGR